MATRDEDLTPAVTLVSDFCLVSYGCMQSLFELVWANKMATRDKDLTPAVTLVSDFCLVSYGCMQSLFELVWANKMAIRDTDLTLAVSCSRFLLISYDYSPFLNSSFTSHTIIIVLPKSSFTFYCKARDQKTTQLDLKKISGFAFHLIFRFSPFKFFNCCLCHFVAS